MTEKEISELYIRLAFQYEYAIDTLLKKFDRLITSFCNQKKIYDSLDK